MKLFITFIITACLFWVSSEAQESEKKALIIAIGDYPENTAWKDISSVNDIPLLKSALGKQGFESFTVLKNEEATKENVVQALEQFTLSLNAGDIAVVHFSSHGQQILDDNKDEFDKLDEAIVCYGAPARYSKDYHGEKHLRDEELGALLEEIRFKLGPKGDLLVFLDACHSGTGTRGNEKVRGGEGAMVPPDFEYSNEKAGEVLSMFEKPGLSRGDGGAQSPMVVFSASRAEEVNYEYNGYGSLSFALNRCFNEIQGEISYRVFFANLLKQMNIVAPKQTPALEGSADRSLFGGRILRQEAYYNIKSIDGGNWLSIEGGSLTGLHKNSEVAIFPAGTSSPKGKAPIAKGRVANDDRFSVNVTIDNYLNLNANEYWLFVTKASFGNQSVKINLSELDKKSRKKIAADLANHPLIEISEENTDFHLHCPDGNSYTLKRSSDGFEYASNLNFTTDYSSLEKEVRTYIQGKFIRELDLGDSEFGVTVEFIPVRVVNRRVVDTFNIEDYINNGVLEFSTNDAAIIKLINNSSTDLYFNLIDIEPSGRINPIIPNPRSSQDPKEFKISKGETYYHNKAIGFAPPLGMETYKVIASTEPLNLTPLIMNSGASSRGNLNNELEKLFKDTYTMSRGTPVTDLEADVEASTYNYIFRIKSP